MLHSHEHGHGESRWDQIPWTRCPTTGKVTYRTKRKAIVALDQMRAKQARGLHRLEADVYQCRFCDRWHLTKQPGLIHERQEAA